MPKIINYQGSMDVLVWQKEYKNIDCDTELIVPVAHEAVFIKDGAVADSFSMGRYILREDCVGAGHLFSNPDERVDCRVYYVKKEGAYSIKWNASQPICITDPVLKIPVEFDISGRFAIKIIDSKKFLTRLLSFTKKASLEEVKEFFRSRMLIYIKDQLLLTLAENKISMIELSHSLMSASKDLELRMRYIFESFGISIEGFMLKKVELLSGGEKCAKKLAGKGGFTNQTPNDSPKKSTEPDTTEPLEALYCPDCGKDLPPLSVFCLNCGVKLKK